MDQNETWRGGRPWTRQTVLDGDPAPPKGGTAAPPLFSAHVYCGKRSPISAIAERLLITTWGNVDRFS